MQPRPKLGILAGGGNLPLRVIEACRDEGREFFIIAFKGQTPKGVVDGCGHAWVRLGAAGTAIDKLREAGVEELVMAGSIKRPSILALMPDLWTTKFLAKVGYASLGDNGILSVIVKELEASEGFRIVGANTLVPDVIVEPGVLGCVMPDDVAKSDIALGLVTAQEIGRMDRGQGCIVEQGVILVTEGAGGTDAMLSCFSGQNRDGLGGVLVKVKKPGQEERTDLPELASPQLFYPLSRQHQETPLVKPPQQS